jgi:hypothetical protein
MSSGLIEQPFFRNESYTLWTVELYNFSSSPNILYYYILQDMLTISDITEVHSPTFPLVAHHMLSENSVDVYSRRLHSLNTANTAHIPHGLPLTLCLLYFFPLNPGGLMTIEEVH